jgi:hypothetical protein
MNRLLPAIAGAAAALASTGCVEVASVKDVMADPEAYLTTQFAPARLRPELLRQLPAGEAPLGFSRLEIQFEDTANTDGKPVRVVAGSSVYVAAGGGSGLVESYDSYSNNGLRYRVNYRLSYRGIQALRWQTAYLQATNTTLMYEAKSYGHIDSLPAHLQPGASLAFERQWGTTVQVMNYHPLRDACTTGERRPGSTVVPGLAGDVVTIDCDTYGENGQVSGKSIWTYLEKYGIAVQTGMRSSVTRSDIVIKSLHAS